MRPDVTTDIKLALIGSTPMVIDPRLLKDETVFRAVTSQKISLPSALVGTTTKSLREMSYSYVQLPEPAR